MNLTAPLPYFGSKRLLAPQIVAHFGPHDTYYDLFAGSLAMLFAKAPCRQEIASEKNADVVNVLRCLANDAEILHRECRNAPLSETLFAEAAARLAMPYTDAAVGSLTRAADFLLTSWQGPSGLAGTTAKPRFAKRNTVSGGSTAARWRSVAESIPAWHDRLRNVEFRNADAFDLIDEIPDRDGVVVYADPPYWPGSRKGGRYRFEMTADEHHALAERLGTLTKTRVVVSYYGCDTTDRLYSGWRRIELAAPRKLNNTAGGEMPAEHAGEVLYVNGADLARAAELERSGS